MSQLLLIGSRSNGYDGLSQSPCLSRMDGLSVPEASLALLCVKDFFPERIVNDSHHNLPLFYKGPEIIVLCW